MFESTIDWLFGSIFPEGDPTAIPHTKDVSMSLDFYRSAEMDLWELEQAKKGWVVQNVSRNIDHRGHFTIYMIKNRRVKLWA